MRELLALLGALLFAAPLAAQDYRLPLSPTAIAMTFCVNQDSTVLSVINMETLGSDSIDEIAVHEAVHRQMDRDSLQLAGHCPSGGGPLAYLAREIAAYCVSDSVRELRTRDPLEAGRTTVARLVYQFWGAVDPETIVLAWYRGCPKYKREP